MPSGGSADSSPTDFAFEPPAMDGSNSGSGNGYDAFKNETLKTPNSYGPGVNFTPNSGSFPFQPQSYPNVPAISYSNNSASSFSSGGGSFSSTDALPAISRDFVRPSDSETRRPATAGASLQTRSPFGFMANGDDSRLPRSSTVAIEDGKPETIDEDSIFNANPFQSPDPKERQEALELPFNSNRRASDSSFQPPMTIQTSWDNNSSQSQNQHALDTPDQQSPHTTFPMTSAPPHITNFGYLGDMSHGNNNQMQMARASFAYGENRPQTSDGLPSYGTLNAGGISLPSARTIVNQIEPSSAFPNQHSFYPSNGGLGVPQRDGRAASMSEMGQAATYFPGTRHYSISGDKPRPGYVSAMGKEGHQHTELTFVPLGGPAPKKRPRRRFDEIERLYDCGWNGCEKSYGTLNHLNAHVMMQKHGEKRLPSEFKEMRKQWRRKKREHNAAVANAHYMSANPGWQATARPSISTDSEYDRRDSTASIFTASSEYGGHRGSLVYAPGFSWPPDSSRPNTSSSVASSVDGRFMTQNGMTHMGGQSGQQSTYNHQLLNPISSDGRRMSVPTHLPVPPPNPSTSNGDHPTPTQQNPFPERSSSMSSASGQPGYNFQSLTSPMPMAAGTAGQYGQSFAFQR